LIGLPRNIERIPASAVVLTASGDTTQNETVLWAQSTNPGNLQFEYGTDPSFSNLQGSISRTIK
jgi:phosphodiesterase/alkaline phosphatase D-like protein